MTGEIPIPEGLSRRPEEPESREDDIGKARFMAEAGDIGENDAAKLRAAHAYHHDDLVDCVAGSIENVAHGKEDDAATLYEPSLSFVKNYVSRIANMREGEEISVIYLSKKERDELADQLGASIGDRVRREQLENGGATIIIPCESHPKLVRIIEIDASGKIKVEKYSPSESYGSGAILRRNN